MQPHRRPLFPALILLAALLCLTRGVPLSGRAADSPATSPTAAAAVMPAESTASADHESLAEEHERELSRIMIALVILLLAAKLGGELVERFGQPAVLGELAFGIIIGNLNLVGFHGLEFLKSDLVLIILAEVGVILLLFEVGLESNVREMAAVGVSSFLVACIGVITPFFLGWATAAYFWSDLESLVPAAMREALAPYAKYVQIFIGGVLCATSVGITARVLKDMGKLQLAESRIILGAAVIDDVLGLIVLAVCVGIVSAASGGHTFGAMDIGWIIAKATVFFVGMAVLGPPLAKPIFRVAAWFRVRGILLTTPLLICFLASYAASQIGLAPIVGAFAAGLILEDAHFQVMPERKERRLEDLITPLTTFLTPIFFVRMGIMVDISAFGNASILGFALVLTAAAIIGKQACSLAVVERKLDRLAVGLGMIPRGEVGLIFANEGTKLMVNGYPVVDRNVLSAVVIMVIITTLVTPPLLKWKFSRASEGKT
ncbi:MAG: cation:proton antiporter [Candidatus Sumerlaeia bacterium]|nr:cation:proton antiporter [Candidatus Sumerlaeia bacterium]